MGSCIKPKIFKNNFLQKKLDVKESFLNRVKSKDLFYLKYKTKKQEFFNKSQFIKDDFIFNSTDVKNFYWNNVNKVIKNQKTIVLKPNFKVKFYFRYFYKRFSFYYGS
jgi:hypothetical protein